MKKTDLRPRPYLVFLSILPIGVGILKACLHYNSVFRSGLLDYFVAAGAILGGVFLFSLKPSKVILLISGSYIVVELSKAIIDYRDPVDVAIAVFAVICLSVPFLRHVRTGAKASCAR